MKPKAYYFDINKKFDDVINSVQFDKNSRFIEVNFLSNSQAVNLTGYRATIRAIKPDKTEVFDELKEIDASVGKYELELTEQLNAVAGDVLAQFEIYGEGESLFTTSQFKIGVSKSLSREKTTSSDELGVLVNVMAEAQQYKNNFVKIDAKIDDEIAKTNAQLSETKRQISSQLEQITQEKATKVEVEIERKRINNFTTLSQGSTTGDAELIDARIGADGVSYENVGSALRGQINQLNKTMLDSDILTDIVLDSNIITGYFINNGGVVSPSTSFAYTSPISIRKGVKITFVAGGTASVSMISKYVDGKYTPLVVGADNNVNIYSYIANEDIQVVLCYRTSLYHSAKIVYKIKPLIELIDDIEGQVYSTQEIDLLNNVLNGYFINNGGKLSDNTSFSITNPILLERGYTISIKCFSTTSPTVSIISKYDNGNYEPLVINIDNTYREYKYTATENMYIVLCFRSQNGYNYSAQKNSSINNRIDAIELNINEVPEYVKIFHSFGIIGDSLSSGEIAYTKDGINYYIDRYNYSWLSNIARENGASVTHYSKGGLTTKTWLNDEGGYRTMFDNDTPKSCYFVALGSNDRNKLTLGTTDDTLISDTFAGYYKEIISLIHSKSPNACIFLVSTYDDNSSSIEFSNMIKSIAELYDYCFYIDYINESNFLLSKIPSVYVSLSHFTTTGYVKVGEIIKKLMNKKINESLTWFKYYALNND